MQTIHQNIILICSYFSLKPGYVFIEMFYCFWCLRFKKWLKNLATVWKRKFLNCASEKAILPEILKEGMRLDKIYSRDHINGIYKKAILRKIVWNRLPCPGKKNVETCSSIGIKCDFNRILLCWKCTCIYASSKRLNIFLHRCLSNNSFGRSLRTSRSTSDSRARLWWLFKHFLGPSCTVWRKNN